MNKQNNLISASDFLEQLVNALDLSPQQVLSSSINGNLSASISARRAELGLTQAQLAEKVGKRQSTISKWENGEVDFSVDLLIEIANALDMIPEVRLRKTTSKNLLKTEGNIVYGAFGSKQNNWYTTKATSSNFCSDPELLEL